ncbi:MAG: hypothetical protein MJE68_11450 [Proteobacteria bacterium]|nr:hypothetical protein [Pseudomonadota bacterium]
MMQRDAVDGIIYTQEDLKEQERMIEKWEKVLATKKDRGERLQLKTEIEAAKRDLRKLKKKCPKVDTF